LRNVHPAERMTDQNDRLTAAREEIADPFNTRGKRDLGQGGVILTQTG